MKFAIIGAGFCGLSLAWNLLKLKHSGNITVQLFDSKEIGKGTSGIAAGLLHPFSGAHAKLNWRGHEGVEEALKLLKVSSIALGRSVSSLGKGILRLAVNDQQFLDFQRTALNFPNETKWLEEDTCQMLVPGCAKFPGLLINEGITVYCDSYLRGLWQACAKKGAHFEKRSIHLLSELEEFDAIIVAAGAETLHFKELRSLPLKLVKGQILEFSWPKNLAPLNCALNSHIYLAMTEGGQSCLVGATYEKGYKEALIDPITAQKELLPKAFELFPSLKEASLKNCYAGMRVVAPNHRPYISQLSSKLWVMTGMGSKGLLYHALFARELVEQILINNS